MVGSCITCYSLHYKYFFGRSVIESPCFENHLVLAVWVTAVGRGRQRPGWLPFTAVTDILNWAWSNFSENASPQGKLMSAFRPNCVEETIEGIRTDISTLLTSIIWLCGKCSIQIYLSLGKSNFGLWRSMTSPRPKTLRWPQGIEWLGSSWVTDYSIGIAAAQVDIF